MRLVGFVVFDTIISESTAEPELVSRWLSPDPLTAEYPAWSPYNFAQSNPIYLIDTDGRQVFVFGEDAGDATTALNTSTALEITRNSESGLLTAVVPDGVKLNSYDKKLYQAISSQEIDVELATTKDNQGREGNESYDIIVGDFQGSVVKENVVVAKQRVNLDHAKVFEDATGGTVGESVGHEVNEAFFGAEQNPGKGYNEAYKAAHNSASAIDPNPASIEIHVDTKTDPKNNIYSIKGVEGPKVNPEKQEIYRKPK